MNSSKIKSSIKDTRDIERHIKNSNRLVASWWKKVLKQQSIYDYIYQTSRQESAIKNVKRGLNGNYIDEKQFESIISTILITRINLIKEVYDLAGLTYDKNELTKKVIYKYMQDDAAQKQGTKLIDLITK